MSRRGGSGIASLELFTDCAIDCKKFKKTADSVLKSITDVSADIAGLQAEWQGDGFEGCVGKGEEFLKQVAKLDISIGQVIEVVQGMEDFAAEIEPEDENSALLVDLFDQRLHDLTSPQVSSHPRLRDFKEAVSAAAAMQQDDELDEEEEMVVDESQEVAMGQVTRSLTCPITRQQFVNPVKSRQCGHTYGKEAVLNHIRISRTRGGARCPVGGCPETVTEDILERDVEMERLIRQAAKKTKKRSGR